MKKTALVFYAALLSCISFAQNKFSPNVICSYYGEPVSLPLNVINSGEDAQRAIAAITDVVGLKGNFELKQANIPNAAAIIYDNKRYILYNPSFISKINNAAGDKWAAIAILAHEIGHHLDGHTLDRSGSHPDTELEADEFSGFVLRKMGATLEQAQSAMKLLADGRATVTHPAKDDRLVSIDNGWTKADDQMEGRKFTAKAIPSKQSAVENARMASANEYSIDAASVNFNVLFNADPAGKYYITKENALVALRGAEVVYLGKLIRLQDNTFPFAIKLNDENFFFVTREGTLLNKSGKQIGSLKA